MREILKMFIVLGIILLFTFVSADVISINSGGGMGIIIDGQLPLFAGG